MTLDSGIFGTKVVDSTDRFVCFLIYVGLLLGAANGS